MKSVILTRVSSEDQVKGKSLDAQRRECQKYVDEMNLDLLKIFEFQESATRGEREELHNCLDYINKQKETIVLVVHCVDRLQRSFKEIEILENFIKAKKLEIHFVREALYVRADNFEEVSLNWDINVLNAKMSVNSLRRHVKKGMKESRLQGLVFKFPEGYLRKNYVVTITDSGRLISEAFELFSTGLYSQVEIAQILNKKGYTSKSGQKLSHQTLNKILNNTFYYGLAKSKLGDYQHNYEPLVSFPLFQKCQNLIKENAVSGKKKKRGFKPYSFRNILVCKGCTRTINPCTSKGKYNYTRCVNNNCEFYQKVVKEEILIKEVSTILKKLVFSEHAIEFIIDKLKRDSDKQSIYSKQKLAELMKERGVCIEMKDNLFNKYILPNSSITQEDYAKKQKELESRIYELGFEITKLNESNSGCYLNAKALFDVVNRLPEIFKSSNTEEKNEILKYLVSNSFQSGQKVEFNVKKPFVYLFKNQSNQRWFGDRDSNPG